MGKLRDQMLTDLQLCGAKPRTQESYLREAENLAKYFNRSPAELGEAELKEYLLYLINLSVLCCRPQVFVQDNIETGMACGEDQASAGQEQTPCRDGPLRGGIPLFGHQESQAQGDADAHVFSGTEGK